MDETAVEMPAATPALGPGDADPRSPVRMVFRGGVVAPGVCAGPGDADPRSPAREARSLGRVPLGPGDDDPRSKPGHAFPIGVALGPGDLVGPAAEYEYVNAPAARPGSGERSTLPVRRRVQRVAHE